MATGGAQYPAFEYATQPVRQGVWLADVRIPSARLELESIYLYASSIYEVDDMVHQLVMRVIDQMRNPPRILWN